MAEATSARRVLVKTTAVIAGQRLAPGTAKTAFTAEPLFKSIGHEAALGLSAGATWHVLTAPDDDGTNP